MILVIILLLYVAWLIPVIIFLAVCCFLLRQLPIPMLAKAIAFGIVSALLVAPAMIPASYISAFQPVGVWLFSENTYSRPIAPMGSSIFFFQAGLAIVSTFICVFMARKLFSNRSVNPDVPSSDSTPIT